jgi:4-hydroxy-tetrahydrodipicolinate synthase
VWPACPTALRADGSFDEPAMRRLVRFLCDRGVDGLWLLGGVGEGTLHSDPLCRQVLEATLDELSGEIPVLVGISAESTARAITRRRHLGELPAAGYFALPPYYYPSDQDEVARFFAELASAVDAPLVLYNNPKIAKVTIEPATVERMVAVDGVAGLKDSSGDLDYIRTIRKLGSAISGFSVLQGIEELAAAGLLAGADGIVTGLGSLFPDPFVEIVRAVRLGDETGARSLQHEVVGIIKRLGWDLDSDAAYIGGLKACLEAIGIGEATVPSPLRPVTEAERDQARRALAGLEGVTLT